METRLACAPNQAASYASTIDRALRVQACGASQTGDRRFRSTLGCCTKRWSPSHFAHLYPCYTYDESRVNFAPDLHILDKSLTRSSGRERPLSASGHPLCTVDHESRPGLRPESVGFFADGPVGRTQPTRVRNRGDSGRTTDAGQQSSGKAARARPASDL